MRQDHFSIPGQMQVELEGMRPCLNGLFHGTEGVLGEFALVPSVGDDLGHTGGIALRG